mmetsp:Transcript_115/g.481  ORF Transcript_115/g.481 Transcript_115/m.481 type:complete len:218 (+) Transcript_115:1284-1937(+)
MPLALPADQHVLPGLVRPALWHLEGEHHDVLGQGLRGEQHQVGPLPIGEQDAVKDHEHGRKEEPDPQPPRRMQQQQNKHPLPIGMDTPEQVVPSETARQPVRASSRARHCRDGHGEDQHGHHDAGECRASATPVQELLQDGGAAHQLLLREVPEAQRVVLDRGRGLDQGHVPHVCTDVHHRAHQDESGDPDVEGDGVVDWDPLARAGSTPQSSLQAL